jgi:predicted HAD superfamily phosphohydrolase YqeG
VECERRKLFSVIVYPLVAHQSIILEVYRRMQVKNSEQVFRKCGTVQIFEKQ